MPVRMGLHVTTHVHKNTSSWRQGAAMMESDLLSQTRLLVRRNRLPANIGLGKEWVIILARSSRVPDAPAGLYETTLSDLKALFPEDVQDYLRSPRRRSNRYLLVRTGSLAMTYWLTLPVRYRSIAVFVEPR